MIRSLLPLLHISDLLSSPLCLTPLSTPSSVSFSCLFTSIEAVILLIPSTSLVLYPRTHLFSLPVFCGQESKRPNMYSLMLLGALAGSTLSQAISYSNTTFAAPVTVGSTWPIMYSAGNGQKVAIAFGNTTNSFQVAGKFSFVSIAPGLQTRR